MGFLCTQSRVDQAYAQKADGQAGGLAMTSHFRTTPHSRLAKDCTSCVEKKICSHLGLLFARSSACSLVVSLRFAVGSESHFPQRKYRACDLLKPEGSACVPLLVYFICSRTWSPRLCVVNQPWKQLYLTAFVGLIPVASGKVVSSDRILYVIGGRVH